MQKLPREVASAREEEWDAHTPKLLLCELRTHTNRSGKTS